MAKKIAPYGTWESPIKPSTFASGAVLLDQIQVNEKTGKIYLLEIRPHEDGRGAIVEYADGGPGKDILPQKYSALSQVHEYGGASFILRVDGRIIFTDYHSKGIFVLNPDTQEVNLLGMSDTKIYYADMTISAGHIVAIKEDHHRAKISDVKNTLVAISGSREVKTLVSGSDFYAYPRFKSNSNSLCWVSWNHPAMPWDITELWVGDFNGDDLANARCIAGKESKSSITQPVWGNDGSLFFADDKTGYWQLYRWDGHDIKHIKLDGLEDADFACPDWWLGCQWYTPMKDQETLVAFINKNGTSTAVVINYRTLEWKPAGFPVNQVYFNSIKRVDATKVAVIGATASAPQSLLLLDLDYPDNPRVLKSSIPVDFPGTYFSGAKHITFPRIHSPNGGEAHAIYLPPHSPSYQALANTLPPLIVAMHGGPTATEGMGAYMRDAFWSSRGYAVVQVNYVGSSGYGREFIRALNGQWGVADIEDAASCVAYLVKNGLVDGNRVAITGHSAGGYATMQALCMYPDLWACGVAESGISDMQVLVEETHKFESQYLKPLIFTPSTSDADRKRIIRERSPIYHAEKIKAPLLILSGADDNIVPPNQAHKMAWKIKAGGGTVDIQVYPGEGHMFTKGSTLEDMEVRREAWFRKYLVGEADELSGSG